MGKKQQPRKGESAERERGADGRRRPRLHPVPKTKYRNLDPDEWDDDDDALADNDLSDPDNEDSEEEDEQPK